MYVYMHKSGCLVRLVNFPHGFGKTGLRDKKAGGGDQYIVFVYMYIYTYIYIYMIHDEYFIAPYMSHLQSTASDRITDLIAPYVFYRPNFYQQNQQTST